MKQPVRIIPRLDIKGPNLVKGIHLEGLRVLGKPEEIARHYYNDGADELLFMDVVASLYERNSLHDMISKTAREIFIPLTVGGGLRSLDDIREVLRAGADKVSLNTAAIKNPEIIRDASREFGTSTIVVAIEAIKESDGRYLAYMDNAREYTGLEVVEWAKKVQDLGAGEILITSVDREGTGSGFDYDLINSINDQLSIPVIVHGGAGSVDHVSELFENTTPDAVAIASILHYGYIRDHAADIEQGEEGNLEFVSKRKEYSKIKGIGISELKDSLVEKGINCRI